MQTILFRFEGLVVSKSDRMAKSHADDGETDGSSLETEFTKLWNAHHELAAANAALRTEAAKYSKSTNEVLSSILDRLAWHDLYFDKLVLNREKMPRCPY